MSIFRAATSERSMTRPSTNGPRSLMRTSTSRPFALFVTRTSVSNGNRAVQPPSWRCRCRRPRHSPFAARDTAQRSMKPGPLTRSQRFRRPHQGSEPKLSLSCRNPKTLTKRRQKPEIDTRDCNNIRDGMTTILWLTVTVIAQCIVLLYPPVILFWLIMHTNIQRWRKIGKRAYGIACLAWPALTLPLLYFRQELFSVAFNVRAWNVIPGALAILFAIRIGSQAAQIIPAKTLVGLPELEPSRNTQPLLRSGIYSRTRNPVYLAHWLVILAFAAWSGYAANWALFTLDSIFLPVMIRAEEKELSHRYGAEFDAYMRAVPRFFPKWPW